MPMPAELDGSILTPDGGRRGRATCALRTIDVTGAPPATPTPPLVLPGFVDLHVHGGGGADVMAGAAAVRTMAGMHLRHGTTALLATTVTAPVADIDYALDGIAAVSAAPGVGEAVVIGAHLEGPFLNPDKLGAQPPFARAADPTLVERWCERAPVRVMTYAPECEGADQLPPLLARRAVRGQIGHTLANAALAQEALAQGAGTTHLFNAMSGLDHRAPGVVGAAFSVADTAEIIPDLIHVNATAIMAARRAIPRLYAVTDATAGAGMPDGVYPLGGHETHKAGGAMRLADGTLAGSALTMDRALANLVEIGIPLAEASAMTSARPAAWLGLEDRGRIEVDARADLLVLDADLAVQQVILGGAQIDRSDGA